MPGLLPMKVIKVGNSSQSRVAQACDRCRSKKIRCDGIRPCCSQCANVGFECKTSDKLSRRAFPRGYTESLEDRVRSLEAEVRELKCLLEEKDEKIEVLSRLHPHPYPSPTRKTASPLSPTSASTEDLPHSASPLNDRDDLIRVQHFSSVSKKPSQDSPFAGASSTRAFIDSFSSKLEKSGRSASAVSTDALLSPPSLSAWRRQDATPKTPPRLVSDQLLNIFFQEWAPFYPIVHRPAILKVYGRYTINPDSIEDDKYALTQLNLIFGIAAISSTSRVPQDPSFFERNWTPKLEALTKDVSLTALQCYVLAQIYYLVKSDYTSLLRYRSLGVSICLHLGLHQSQKRFSFNPLVSETRKRVFWCQYTLDRFAAALTGLPVMLSESDICTEYPTDIDDENVTETGFVPTIPEESTRISAALALFSASRILNRVLEELYPASEGYEISLSTVHSLAEELEDWLRNLPTHLRLEFVQDKPSAALTGSRAPLLSIVYYLIRTLIRRPAVCFGAPSSSSPSMLSLVDSAKHIIQLLKLLDERRMSLSLCINKRELIFISGLGFLWQSLDLSRDSKLVKEGQKMLTAAVGLLESESIEAAVEFSSIINLVSQIDISRRNSTASVKLNQDLSLSTTKGMVPKKQLQQLEPLRTRFSISSESGRPTPSQDDARMSSVMVSSPELSRSVRSSSSHSIGSPDLHDNSRRGNCLPSNASNADNLAMSYFHEAEKKPSSAGYDRDVPMSEWEHVLSDIDSGHSNIFTGIYGGSECGQTPAAFATLGSNYRAPSQQQHSPQLPVLQSSPHSLNDWSQESWATTSNNTLRQENNNGAAVSSSVNASNVTSEPDYSDGNRMRDTMMRDGQTNSPRHIRQNSRAQPLDPYEAIVIPHSLDPMEETPDFSAADTWVPQCVM
ncbi:hypothetical protein FQN57_003098 [Myotisia sp. PD_48]|nr:hypothetical protein FQN57_003098 [Myotisia sp. PD_48]